MKAALVAQLLLLFVRGIFMRIELKDFYPYGTENGDTLIPDNDDGSSGRVDLTFPFPFFNRDHDSLFVNTNGAISFLVQVAQFTPDAFPLGDKRRLIAPFWADVDTRRGGDVYYRETQDLAIRTRVSEEIRKHFVRQRHFTAKWAMIVTWLNVAPFGGGSSLFRNTFQTIIATDGATSFSIFYYNKIRWTYGSASRKIPAQAGFNAGDGLRYFSIPNSRTKDIINIASTSNYEIPGLWIFQVDGETVEDSGCKPNGGKLVLSPRSGTELGGTKIYIGGPCFDRDDEIVCRFNNTLISSGVYISFERAYCVSPPLYIAGRISLELSTDGGKTFNFTGVFRTIPLGRNPPDVQGLEVKNWINPSTTLIKWDKHAFNTSTVDIEVLLFDSYQYRLDDQSLVSHRSVPNTGSYQLDLNIQKTQTRIRTRRNTDTRSPVAIVKIASSVKRTKRFALLKKIVKAIFSPVFLAVKLISHLYCNIWFGLELGDNEIKKLQDELPPCPTSLRAIQADRGTFVGDEGIKRLLSGFYHPGSKQCFRSIQSSRSGAGQQCCYDHNDRLIVGPAGGGTLDVASPAHSFWGHMGRDVLPWFACCKLSNNCNKYYKKRPSDDGSRYQPPPVAATNGDPHLVTFDGTPYTFNGQGEFTLLTTNDDTRVHFLGRMEPLTDNRGRETKATALTALVVKENGSDVIQVEFDRRRIIDVFVNSQRVEFNEQSRLDFTGVFVAKQNRSKVGIYLNSGISINVKAIEEFLTYDISLPVTFKGKTAGLLGFWDDSKEREFLLPNGSFVNTDSSSRSLHYDFGLKWTVRKNDTLFTYRIGKNYDSYHNPGFTPVFLDGSTPLFSNSTLEREANAVCGENKECLFDIAVTGRKSVGEATKESMDEIQERQNNSRLIAQPVFFGCDGVENSGNQTDACGVCGGNNSTCTDCDGNIRPDFVNNATCVKYLPWSNWGTCSKSCGKGIMTRTRNCTKIDQCRDLGAAKEEKKCNVAKCDGVRAKAWSTIYILISFYLFFFSFNS